MKKLFFQSFLYVLINTVIRIKINILYHRVPFKIVNKQYINPIPNTTPSENKESIKNALKNQMANKVRWTDSIKKLEETDTTQIIEIGPGKVLSGLIARITKKFDIKSIDKIEDLKKIN